MVTNNLKSYKDNDILQLISSIEKNEMEYNLNDLKVILAEVTSRKLDQKYIDLLAELIRKNIESSGTPEQKRLRRQMYTMDKKEDYDDDDYDDDYEKFPVLSLLAGVYKILGWAMIMSTIVIGTIISLKMYINNILAIVGIMLASVALGTIFILIFYAASESIVLKLEIEKHLRKRS